MRSNIVVWHMAISWTIRRNDNVKHIDWDCGLTHSILMHKLYVFAKTSKVFIIVQEKSRIKIVSNQNTINEIVGSKKNWIGMKPQ